MNAQQMTPPADPSRYEIRLAGQLDQRWSDWFEGFTLIAETDGTTTLTGPVVDQAALHGLLRRVGDLGVTLVSVNVLDSRLSPHPSARLPLPAHPGSAGYSGTYEAGNAPLIFPEVTNNA
jgi:hypothetical protein